MKNATNLRLTVTLSVLPAVLLLAGCESFKRHRVTDRTEQTRESATQTAEGYDTLGRKWGDKTVTAPPTATTEARKEAAGSALTIRTGLVDLTKRVPAAAALGETFCYDIVATAVQDAGNVVITDTVPDGATFVSSEPSAAKEGNLLTWRMPVMQRGETKTIKVCVKADREGELVGCPTITAVPRGCVSTFVGKPMLAITKTGPETALLGADITYNIVVANRGTSLAKDVVVTDALPEGLTHASAQSTLTFNVGDLAPGQSKAISVPVKAAKRGKHCNPAVASSSNAGKVNAEACTVVTQPGLRVAKVGDKEQFLGRNARYTVTVTNTGDMALSSVLVTDTAPDATTIVSADGASVSGRTATWSIPELKAGETRSFNVVLTSQTAGTHCNGVTAAAAGVRDSAQACTLWRGQAAILIEVVDDPDPIQVGGTTTYTIRVTNQGTADDTNVRITANFPREITPTQAAGGAIDGQTVKYQPVARLAPKQSITYTINARGAAAGDARLKVLLDSDLLKTPVTEEESTHVY
jgi:uncharacterized repeat protein (TIGR01451 family)